MDEYESILEEWKLSDKVLNLTNKRSQLLFILVTLYKGDTGQRIKHEEGLLIKAAFLRRRSCELPECR